MAFCNSCGASLDPSTRFCNKCGAAVLASTPVPNAAMASSTVPVGTVPAPAAQGGGALKVILIVVGVALDVVQKVESHLLMRHYEGFMKTGRVRGRRQ